MRPSGFLPILGLALLIIALPTQASMITGVACAGKVTVQNVTFTCDGGRWSYVGDIVLQKDMVIDGVDRPVYIQGNLSSVRSNDVLLKGTNAGLNVTGCVDLGQKGNLVSDWSEGWPNTPTDWTQYMLTQGRGLAPGIFCRSVPNWILRKPPHEGCTRLTTYSDHSTVNGLRMVLKTSRSHCHLVIALSVVGGLVAAFVVGMIIFAIVRGMRKASDDGYMAINN